MSIPAHLLPGTARTGDGRFEVGGCDLSDVAAAFGTPLLVYDEEHLRNRCREARAAFPAGVSYASKAFLCLAMARLAHEEGLSLDISSGGELHVALAAGVPGAALIMHGNNKSAAELELALSAGVGRIVVDSDDEIERIVRIVDSERMIAPKIMLRLNPGVRPDTHAFISTGHSGSKFGFRVDTGDAARALRDVARDSRLELAGVHVHVGSQLLDLRPIGDGVAAAARVAAAVDAEELSVGGGLGVAHTVAETAPSMAEWAQVVREAVRTSGFSGRVVAEPGRSLVATAGVTLYRIGTIKAAGPGLTFVSVDGGLSDNPRPALYGSEYEAFLPRDPRIGPDLAASRKVSVVGKNCESGDTLVRDAFLPPDVAVGDLLCMPVTGAYTHAMSSNYNKLLRPAVVFVRNGDAHLVVRRQTPQDLTRWDTLPATGVA